MKKNISLLLLMNMTFVILMLTQGCEKNNETIISNYNGDESHNMGENCMECHKTSGKGEGVFKVAGTVYDSLLITTRKNGTVRLYSGPDLSRSLIATIEVDGKGNFFTTESIDFIDEVYVSITGSSGDRHDMISSISSGQCNSCHGVTTDKIWIK